MFGELVAQPTFKKIPYTKQQGLSHNTVLNLTMDDRGFLWIATLDGLNRFDGLQMKTYRHNPSDSTSISDNFIHGIYQHEDGNIWITTRDGGVNILDTRVEKFYKFESKSLPSQEINIFWKDSDGTLWLGANRESLGILNDETFEYISANIVDSKTNERKVSSNSIIEFKDKSLLFSSFNGLYYIPAKEVLNFKNNLEKNTSIGSISIPFSKEDPTPNSSNLFIDSNGDLWVNFVNSGLKKMNNNYIPDFLKKSIATGVLNNSTESLVVEREGYLISGATNNQLLYINLKTGEKILKPLDHTVDFDGNTYLYEDLNNELWAFTWGNGFYKLNEKQGIKLFNKAEYGEIFKSNFMLGFEEDPLGFWIGTAQNVLFYSNDDESISSLNEKLANDRVLGIWDFERDSTGLWIATNEKGLVFISEDELLKQKGIQSYRFTHQNSILKSKNLHQVYRDSRDWLWLGYEGDGIQILKNSESLFDQSIPVTVDLNKTTNNEKLSIPTNQIREFYEDNDQNIWVSTIDAGFLKIEIEDNQIQSISSFRHQSSNKNSIPHNDGRYVHQQNDSTYWFATYGGGIAKWNVNTNIFTRYNTDNGLPNNSTYSVLGNKNSPYLWISTNSGLARLNTITENFDVFTETDGLQNNEFNTGAYATLNEGRFVFGGINGFNIITTNKLQESNRQPPVYITGINLFNEPLATDSAHIYKKQLTLSYNKNFLSFNFAALDFDNPSLNNFAYKMEGIDEDWVYSQNRNYASYPNLNPGKYVFKVKAQNSKGIWNTDGASLTVVISPPWWQTIWFRIIASMLVLITFILAIRYFSQRKLRKQIQKMEVENKLRKERERISRDLHDHVGAQLANIMSGLSLVNKYNQVDNKEKSSVLMNSLRGDAELTIKQLRETIWALNQSELTMLEFRGYLKTYFGQQTAFNEQIKLVYNFDDDLKVTLSSAQVLNIFRIIQEAAQNTLKYADADTFLLEVTYLNEKLSIRIKDNGSFKGENDSGLDSYGIGNMRKRALELGGDIKLNTKNGTEILLTLPIKNTTFG